MTTTPKAPDQLPADEFLKSSSLFDAVHADAFIRTCAQHNVTFANDQEFEQALKTAGWLRQLGWQAPASKVAAAPASSPITRAYEKVAAYVSQPQHPVASEAFYASLHQKLAEYSDDPEIQIAALQLERANMFGVAPAQS